MSTGLAKTYYCISSDTEFRLKWQYHYLKLAIQQTLRKEINPQTRRSSRLASPSYQKPTSIISSAAIAPIKPRDMTEPKEETKLLLTLETDMVHSAHAKHEEIKIGNNSSSSAICSKNSKPTSKRGNLQPSKSQAASHQAFQNQ